MLSPMSTQIAHASRLIASGTLSRYSYRSLLMLLLQNFVQMKSQKKEADTATLLLYVLKSETLVLKCNQADSGIDVSASY